MSLDKKNSINNILEEKRIFPPSKKFAENSNISSQEELLSLNKQASDNPIQFWESFAKSELDWFEPFHTVLDSDNAPFFKWFKEGKLNITYNCLDRHIKRGLGGKTALIWEGEPGDSKKYTYEQLLKEVCKAAGVLSGINNENLSSLYDFGKNIGLAFQVVDDILDFTGNDKQLGKPAVSDLASGYPVSYTHLRAHETN